MSSKNKPSLDIFRHISLNSTKVRSILGVLLPRIARKWYLLGIPSFLILLFLLESGKNTDNTAVIFFLVFGLFLLSIIKRYLLNIEDRQSCSIKINVSLQIEGFRKTILPVIGLMIVISMMICGNSLLGFVGCTLGYSLVLIIGILSIVAPISTFNEIRSLSSNGRIMEFLLYIMLPYSGLFSVTYLYYRPMLVPLILLFTFPICLSPKVFDKILMIIHELVRLYYKFIRLEILIKKFRIDLREKKKYELPDDNIFWHFSLGMSPFCFFYLVSCLSSVNIFEEARKLTSFFMIGSVFLTLIPLYVFAFFLSLLDFSWGTRRITILILYKYLLPFSIFSAFFAVFEWNLPLDISQEFFFFLLFVFGVSMGLTITRKCIAEEIKAYFRDPRFEKTLDYLEVIK